MDRSTEKFNGRKYGKYWNTIDFELTTGGESTYTVNPGDKPTMGYLLIGNSRFPITESEANRLIETLEDAKHSARVSKSMGLTKHKTSGTFRSKNK